MRRLNSKNTNHVEMGSCQTRLLHCDCLKGGQFQASDARVGRIAEESFCASLDSVMA